MSISCEVARDLIPICADKTASRDSLCAVSEHVKYCKECGKFYKDCRRSVKRGKRLRRLPRTQSFGSVSFRADCEEEDTAELLLPRYSRRHGRLILRETYILRFLTAINMGNINIGCFGTKNERRK